MRTAALRHAAVPPGADAFAQSGVDTSGQLRALQQFVIIEGQQWLRPAFAGGRQLQTTHDTVLRLLSSQYAALQFQRCLPSISLLGAGRRPTVATLIWSKPSSTGSSFHPSCSLCRPPRWAMRACRSLDGQLCCARLTEAVALCQCAVFTRKRETAVAACEPCRRNRLPSLEAKLSRTFHYTICLNTTRTHLCLCAEFPGAAVSQGQTTTHRGYAFRGGAALSRAVQAQTGRCDRHTTCVFEDVDTSFISPQLTLIAHGISSDSCSTSRRGLECTEVHEHSADSGCQHAEGSGLSAGVND